jgi:anthranilate phosphoribosyltransferase
VIQTAISKVANREKLTAQEARVAMMAIMDGAATPAQIGGLATGLRVRGETAEEIEGFAVAMRERGVRIKSRTDAVADTCGTGGDGKHTLNISTGAALAAAGAGIAVAKHGNRAMSSRAGSADALEALGVKVDAEPETVERCLNEVGMAFCYAQKFHPAMRFAGPPRKEIGIRTIFNLLGPLTNPAGAMFQLIGVPESGMLELMAEALARLGTARSLVVSSADGLDELSTTSSNAVIEVTGRKAGKRMEWVCQSAGLRPASLKDLAGGSPEENAEALRAVLSGERNAFRDAVVYNAGAICWLTGRARTMKEAVILAARSVDSGAAAGKLEELKAASNRAATEAPSRGGGGAG